jgi:catechol 2,3-dioxygenase-like lactoylglutathione lyase family enzyme
MTPKPQFNAIGTPVADMAASIAFYRTLGLDVPDGAEGEPHVEIPLASGVKLMLDTYETVRAFEPEWTPPGGGQMSLAFECASPAEVDATYKAVTGAGYEGHLEPWDAFWGQRYAVLHDPDGNGVDLYAALTNA